MRLFWVGLVLLASCERQSKISCKDAPLVTYNNFGQGFLSEHCQGCHASTAPDRNDAPEEITFDTADEAWEKAEDILLQATGEEPLMPPRGGVSEEDRLRLEVWLTCAPEGN